MPTLRRGYRRRWAKFAAAGFALLLLSFLVVTYVPLGDVTGVDVSLQSGKIKANNNLSSSSTTSAGDSVCLPLRRILILNSSDHIVMRHVANLLAKQLAGLSMTNSVDVMQWRGASTPPADGLLYDYYIVLEMPRFETEGLLITGRQINATVVLHGGQQPWDSRHGYTDHLTPPVVRVDFQARLDHESVTTGYESASARYTLVRQNIADQLAKALTRQFGQWRAKFGEFGEMPDGLIPTFQPVPADFPLPTDPGPQRVISGRGLMVHNYTVWTMRTADSFGELKSMHDHLEQLGWKNESSSKLEDTDWGRYFRMWSDDRTRYVQAYEVKDRNQQDSDSSARLVIEYRHRMSREQIAPVVERLLAAADPPVTLLLALGRNMTAQHSRQLTELLMASDFRTALINLRVARHLHRQGNDEQAMTRLREALVLARVLDDGPTSEMEKLAEEITGQNDWQPAPPTGDELAALGFEVLAIDKPIRREVQLKQKATFYVPADPEADEDAGPWLVWTAVLPSNITQGPYALAIGYRKWDQGGGTSRTTPHYPPTPWRADGGAGYNGIHWRVKAEQVGKDRFAIELFAHRSER